DKNVVKQEEEESIGGKIVEHGKKAFSRAIFHLKAWGTGILMEVLTGFIPASMSVTVGATGLSSILGMFLLFPFHTNHTATLLGGVVAGMCIAAGYWPLAIALGGLAAAVIHVVNRRSAPLAYFFVIPMLLIALSFVVGTALLASLPVWFYAGTGASLLLGMVRPHWLVRLSNKLFGFSDKKHLKVDEKDVIDVEEIVESKGEFASFPAHVMELEKMKAKIPLLPEDMAEVVREIKLKTRGILKCMGDDPRDVMPGNQFLNRYLPMLNTTIERFSALTQYNSSSVEFEKTKERTLHALIDMSDAFAQAHQRLVDNDVDDLLISLKVMDQLRKSDGYQRED
ncbi:MAG: 5-bromo-4-chloroindolyl phosphate hydrolysis family protein, partial [Saezia sp.]